MSPGTPITTRPPRRGPRFSRPEPVSVPRASRRPGWPRLPTGPGRPRSPARPAAAHRSAARARLRVFLRKARGPKEFMVWHTWMEAFTFDSTRSRARSQGGARVVSSLARGLLTAPPLLLGVLRNRIDARRRPAQDGALRHLGQGEGSELLEVAAHGEDTGSRPVGAEQCLLRDLGEAREVREQRPRRDPRDVHVDVRVAAQEEEAGLHPERPAAGSRDRRGSTPPTGTRRSSWPRQYVPMKALTSSVKPMTSGLT